MPSNHDDQIALAKTHLEKVEVEIARRKKLGMDCSILIKIKASIDAFIASGAVMRPALTKAQHECPSQTNNDKSI